MFRGFKNSEYLKYTISNKIDKEFNHSREFGKSILIQMLSSVFSATITNILVSTLQGSICIDNQFLKFFAILGIALITIFVSFLFFYFIFYRLYRLFQERHIAKFGYSEIHELIEKFDNIACDSIIVVEKYLDDISNGKLSKEIIDYSLFEAIYYMRKATDIVSAVMSQRNECTSEIPDIAKIDMFRVRNVVKILRSQIDKITVNYLNGLDDPAKSVINTIDVNLKQIEKEFTP